MSLFQPAVHLFARHGRGAVSATKQVVNLFVPGGSLLTGALEQVLESAHDYAKDADESLGRGQHSRC